MPLRPPKKFRVLGQTFSVEVAPQGRPSYDTNALGAIDHDLQVAFIRTDMGVYAQLDTYLHEALHAINGLGGLMHHFSEGQDEPYVDAFASQLLHFLRDNPTVVKYLTQPVEA